MSDTKDEEAPRKGKKGKFLLLLAGLLLVAGGGAFAFWLLPSPDVGEAVAATSSADVSYAVDPGDIVFVEVPDLLVNLNHSGSRLRFLKFVASLEVVGEEEAGQVDRLLPRITDNVHAYLRAMSAEELAASDAVYRIKLDLLTRINQVVAPAEVRDVLIREMLIQ